MNRPLLEVRNLRTGFHTARGLLQAVDDVSFELKAGETLGIVGESGCGKSVLAKSLLGLLPRAPFTRVEGEIYLAGRNLLALGERDLGKVRGKEIAMIFQDPMTSLNPVLTIGRQIVQVLRLHTKLSARAAHERAVELLAQVNIPAPRERAQAYPHQLSGGMRQRAVIALALACNPALLVADEPTTALDVTVQAQVLELLRRLQEAHGMALILISHNLGVVAGMCDRVAVMYAGKIVEEADTGRLFAAPRMHYTEALLRSMPRLDNPGHSRLYTIDGYPPQLIDPADACRFSPRCGHADERCRAKMPAYASSAPGHRYACWNPVQGGRHGG